MKVLNKLEILQCAGGCCNSASDIYEIFSAVAIAVGSASNIVGIMRYINGDEIKFTLDHMERYCKFGWGSIVGGIVLAVVSISLSHRDDD